MAEVKNQFQCGLCLGIYDLQWTDEEAMEIYEKDYPGEPFDRNKMVLLCQPCYDMTREKKDEYKNNMN